MKNSIKLMIMILLLSCITPFVLQAETYTYPYKIDDNYTVTIVLRETKNIAVKNGIVYCGGNMPSVDISGTANPKSGYYYTTTIDSHAMETGEKYFEADKKNSFSLSRPFELFKDTTIAIWVDLFSQKSLWSSPVLVSSDLIIFEFMYDYDPPVVTISSNGQVIGQILNATLYTNQSPVTLTGNAKDDGSGVNEETWIGKINGKKETDGKIITLDGDGTYLVGFEVADRVKVKGSTGVTVIIDRTAPEIILSVNPESGWSGMYGTGVELSVYGYDLQSALDRQTWQFSTNGGESWSPEGEQNTKLTITEEGRFDVRFRVKDRAGNIRVTPQRICGVDKTGPALELKGDMGDTWTADSQKILEIKATDSVSGLARLSYSQNNIYSWIQLNDFQTQVTITGEGRNTIFFSAADTLRNESWLTANVNIDTTPPTIYFSFAGNSYKEDTGWIIPLRISHVSDSGSMVDFNTLKYSLDGGTETKFTYSSSGGGFDALIPVAVLSQGSHTLKILAADNVGNIGERTERFIVDTIPPDISVDLSLGETPEEAPWTRELRVGYTIIDGGTGVKSSSVSVNTLLSNGYLSAFNGAASIGSVIVFKNDAPDGIYQVLITAKDNANNTAEKIFYYKLDRTPPEISPTLIKSGLKSVTITGADTPAVPGGPSSGLGENCWSSPVAGVSGPGGYTVELPEGLHEREFTLRDIAGNSTTQRITIYIDLSPPEIVLTLPEYGAAEKIPLAINARDNFTEITNQWYILDGLKTFIDKAHWKSVEIPLDPYTEGYHTIRVGAVDELGNSGESAEYQFIIDRSPPELWDFELRDGSDRDRVILKDDYIPGDGILVKITGEDQFVHGTEKLPGIIKSYYWDLKQKSAETPVFVLDRKFTGNEFAIKNLSDGINYLFVRAEDGAGNRSNVLDFTVLQDQSIPGSPMIRSDTHREAQRPEQAGFLSRAEFSFSPAFEMKSGIKIYQWKIEKLLIHNGYEGDPELVQEGKVTGLDQEGKGSLSIELGDNNENEFYILSVRCIGGNTKSGSWARYQFRIDSEPPGELRVQAIPQVDSSRWYNQWDTIIRWNKPSDMTGVAEYRYCILPELDESDVSSWNRITDTQLPVNLRNILGSKKSGELQIGVCAIDYAGNRKIGTGSFKYDFIPPVFEDNYLTITDAEDYMGAGKRIRWGRLEDGESGVDHIAILITEGDHTRTYTVGSGTTEYIVSPLEEDRVYTVVVRGYDGAGNRTELYDIFTTGNAVIPETYTVPYWESINGYQLSGKRRIGKEIISFEDITLQVPDALEVYAITFVEGSEIRQALREIPLREINVKDGAIESGQTGKGTYELSAGGFTLEGGSFRFSRTGGLDFADAVYTRPMIVSGLKQEREVPLGNLSLGFPSLIQFNGGSAAIGAPVHIENTTEENPGFTLTGVESLALRNGKEWFNGNEISFDRTWLTEHSIYLGSVDEGDRVKLMDSSLEAGSKNLTALFAPPDQNVLHLTLGNAVYTLKKAGIRGSSLDIYEAVLSLPEGYEPRELVIRNFTIDGWNGLVYNGPDFLTENIKVTSPGGAVFEGTRIEFDPQGNLIVSGTISSELYGIYRTEDIILTNNGIDWENGAGINGFTADVHGFLVNADKARLTPAGIFISEGVVNVWNNQQPITGLGLGNKRKDEVWQDGTIVGAFSGDPGYGAPVQMSGGRISGEGVFANAALPLGNDITDQDGAGYWNLFGVKLYPNVTMTGKYEGEKLLIIANTPIMAEDINFDEGKIRIGKGRVEGIQNLNPGNITFTGMSFNYRGISSEGISGRGFTFNASGWEISYGSLGFDRLGIKGQGSLRLPVKLGGLTLDFPETRISADGSLTSGIINNVHDIFEFHHVPLSVDGISLKILNGNYALEMAYPLVSLKQIDGPDISFGSAVFDSEGWVLAGNDGPERIDFIAFNGYEIGVENSRIENDGLILEGTVKLQWAGQRISIPAGKFMILPDYSIIGTIADTEFLYRFGDWSISGRDIQFDIDRIQIGSNRVLFRELTMEIGEISFSAGGQLLQRVIQKQDLGVSLFGAGAKITETRFSDKGIEATVIITLPFYLGGQQLTFDTVGFNADGGFLIEKKIDQFDFTALAFTFNMKEITLDQFGLYAEETSIILPESLEGVSFKVRGLRISNTGGVSIENTEISPFTIWNINFNLNNFSILNEKVEFAGSIRLPKTISEELSTREIQINEFRVDLRGGIWALDMSLNGEYLVPLTGAWELLLRNIRVNLFKGQPVVMAEQVKLLFPPEYVVRDAYVDQAKFDLLTGKFIFSEITLTTDISMNFFGIDFTLNKLQIDSEQTLGFGGSAHFSGPGLPGFLAGKTAQFNRFEIHSNGTLGEIDVRLDNLEGSVIPGFDGLVLKKGHIALLKEGEKSLILDIGGNITLNSSMPGGLAGTALKIDTFTFDTADREIKRLKATVVLPTANSLGNIFSKLSIGIDWNEAKQTGFLNLSGNLILPNSFPEFLAGREAKISNFKIGFDGIIQSFTAKYSTEKNKPYGAFGFLQLSDVAIEAALKSGVMKFDLAGIVILPADKFPQGIGGLRASITMEFDTTSGLKTASADAALPVQKLFGAMELRNGRIGISKPENKALEISVGGELQLPDIFPEGLRGIIVGIRKFTINTSGEILDVDIGVSNLNAKLFGIVDLVNGSMSFRKGSGYEFLISMGGSIRLANTGLPENIRKASLEIRALELSTRDGLKAFDVGLNSGVTFSILGGVQIAVNSLSLSESGISISGGAKLPSNYPNGLANTQITLTVLKLGWNGSLQDIRGGIGAWSMTLAGFTAKIDELFFDKDTAGQFWVTLKSCKIQIPQNFGSFGGQYIAIKNAKFSPYDGSFLGDIELSKLETEIAGFKLIMDKPSIEFSANQISFSKVTLKLPDFLSKGEITLNKVKLSASSGLQVSGGAIKLPNFNIGVLIFNDVKVNFSISASQYTLDGSGSVLIPGAGNLSASLGFATKSQTYPIGLKQAEFSYVIATGGIPLGTSGLVINGIKGGLSYGPPSEVPIFAKGLFNDQGPRIALGLHLGDAMGGKIIDMNPTTWVDISNGTWAFMGKATVLKGSLNLNTMVSAAMGSKGFVGQLYVNLVFAEGEVTVYIFDKNGRTILSGEGSAKFGIPKGAIFSFWFIKIPPVTLWLARVNAAFGQFTNGKTGFKGTVSIPIIGPLGIYVGSGGVDFGSLSSYKIEKPSWIKSIRNFEDPNISSLDQNDRSGADDVSYRIFVPPKGKELAAPLSMLYEEYPDGNGEIPDSGLDRLIVVLEYAEGAPQLTVSSPSGIEYREGYEGTETSVEENGVILVIHSAEAGIWQLRVSGLEEDAYELHALGSMVMPVLELLEPAAMQTSEPERVSGEVRVRGISEPGKTRLRIFAREEMDLPGLELGTYSIDGGGRFDLMVPVQDLTDGEYYIYAQFEGPGEEFSPTAYAPGKILVDRGDLPLLAPGGLRIAETDPGILSLHWQNTNGGRTEGYKVKIRDNREETESIVYVGNITALKLPGYASGDELSFAVAALDNTYQAGPWSEPVLIRPGQEKPVFNHPITASERFYARGVSGGFIEAAIKAEIKNFHIREDASGYIGARYTGPEQDQLFNIHFDSPVKVTETSMEISWYMGIPESLGPGVYEYPFEFFNEANSALNSSFTLVVEISWPEPEITAVEPSEINGIDENILTVYGNGFVPGTRAFWQDEELVIRDDSASSGSMQVTLPPRASPFRVSPNSMEQGELTLEGPGGNRAAFPVAVLLPSWKLTLYTRTAETIPGGKLDYTLGISSLNGFEGPLPFKVLNKPDELEISLPVISVKNRESVEGVIGIYVRENARAGSYIFQIEGEGGRVFELVTLVLDTPPVPRLSSVVPRAAYTGGEVHIYGYGLGSSGSLFLNGKDVPVSRWSGEEITFIVPDDGLSGTIYVRSEGGESNALAFTVRDRGFALHPGVENLELNAGEEKILPIVVTGYSDTVKFDLLCEPGAPFTAFLDRDELKSNGRFNMHIRAEAFAGNGSWQIIIRGTSRGFETAAEITVHIGSSLSITTNHLPDGLVEVSYYAELSSRNVRGELEYLVIRGSLPPGLTMTAQGIISGRPLEPGQYQVDIEVQDRMGWKDKRSFTIRIWEEVWGQAGKDGAQSWSVRTDLPASDDTAWTYDGEDSIIQLLGAENRIIALGRENLTALHAGDGSTAWKIKGDYEKALYAGGKLYALTKGGLLEVRDLRSGTLLWSREGIQAISTDGTTILEETADRRFFRNAERGTLIEEQGKAKEGPVLWRYGTAYLIEESILVPLYGPGKPWDAGERILALGADLSGGAAITENSLILFDADMTETRRISYTHHSGCAISLTDEGVSVLDNGTLWSYDREDLKLQWVNPVNTLPGDNVLTNAVLGNGKEKTVIAGKGGLLVLNRYTGGLIWQDEKPYTSFALYHEKIFASDAGGAIRAFNGPPNIHGPVTEIRIEPDYPDGSEDWYTLRPVIEISSSDRETYAAEILMQHNNGLWEDAPASLIPEDGEHFINAYGIDTRGMKGAEARRQFKVDTGLPESVLILSPEEPESGWYNQPLTLTLDARDDVSGIDWIWTSVSSYNDPILFADQGIHSFSWYALDRAGNRESLRQRYIRIDLEPPYVEASVAYDQGMGELTINARDSLSGTAFIEYRINNDNTEQYHEPVLFTEPGIYQVRYRAVDRAGNSGFWQRCDVGISSNPDGVVLIDSALINGMSRPVISHARNGMSLMDAADDAAMLNLPSYTLGAEYILWDEGDARLDESARISFRVKRNAVVYLFLPQNTAAPGSWSFVEARAGINRRYYPGGAAVYMRRYSSSDLVEIPGTPGGTVQPLIMVQEKGSIGADILIHRIEDIDEIRIPADTFIPEALVRPWQYSRRLPLRKRWFVNAGDGWIPLEENRYEAPGDTGEETISVPLRFRLELYTPDGELEYRAEKVYGIGEDF